MTTSIPTRLLLLTALQVLVALVFLKGFLLTRVELPDVAGCQQGTCGSSSSSGGHQLPGRYSKAVVLIVDAVRYDFLCGKQGADGNGQLSGSLMPKTLRLVQQAGAGAAVASRFVADTPTITMSRLKALLTGGLPTFLDIGQSFSASAITEDNLLQQLLAKNKTLVMMGDDTWMQLAQHAFAEAYPYPSFNVHDLHTVDDGVWEHLLPLLARPGSWDVLVAHYLGVDHAGHTYGVNSRQMEDKLAQMDDQVSTVIDMLVAQAGPGGAYADTLLVVLSDHGQTQGGDHGGGTPDETDSILVTLSLSTMNATREQQQAQDGHAGNRSSSEDSSFLLQLMASAGYAAQHPAAPPSTAAAEAGMNAGAETLADVLVCKNTVPQIDLTPLLAHALGVPIPFGNLGKLPPHLFLTLAAAGGTGTPRVSDWLQQYAAALAANAAQVHNYLNRYAAVGGLPAGQLAAVNELYAALRQQQGSSTGAGAGAAAGEAGQLRGLVAAQLYFLGVAAELARRRFTLFQQGPIWAGCGLGVAVLGLQLWYLSRLLRAAGASSGGQGRVSMLAFAGLAAFHALGLFSVGLLMGEGRLTCVLLAAVTLVLLQAALGAVLQARKAALAATKQQQRAGANSQQQPAALADRGDSGSANHSGMAAAAGRAGQQQPQLRLVLPQAQAWGTWRPAGQAVRAAASMLVCNVSLQLLGLIDRSGQDPHDKTQPTSELLVGPDAAWQRAALVAFTAGPLFVMWAVFVAVSRLLQSSQGSTDSVGSRDAAAAAKQAAGASSAGCGSSSVVRCLRALCASQFVCLGLFWATQLFGHGDATVVQVGRAAWAAVLPYLPPGPVAALTGLAGDVMEHHAIHVVCSAAATLCSLPLRLVLPRLIYSAALLVLAAAVLVAAWPGRVAGGRSSSRSLGAGPGGAVVLLWLCAVLSGPLVTVLGFKGPATVLLALMQAVGLCRLLRVRAAAASFAGLASTASDAGDAAPASGGKQGVAAGGDDGCCSVVGAGAWGLMALQLFFCSGHFCEFSGLQYASAFIGFDDMVWFSSGSLLLINTCGFLFLGPLSLPVFVACCGSMEPSSEASAGKDGRNGSSRCDGRRTRAAESAGVLRQQAECALWVTNSTRFAALVVSLVSAAVQQQHILLWAIFAPKLVFELWFMLVTAAGQLLVAGLVQHCL